MTDITAGTNAELTVAEAVCVDDAELLFAESTPRDDHSLGEFGGAALVG